MKKIYRFFSIFVVSVFCLQQINAADFIAKDTVTMGAGYNNDVYYSISTGTVKTVQRNNWDIAFTAHITNAAIWANTGSGIVLFHYPKADTSGWTLLDTAGLSTWKPLQNSLDNWQDGAFNSTQLGHPDYGWGVYSMTTHNLVGDSLYIIKLIDNTYRKLWIQKKHSTENTFYFKYANLDNSNEQSVVLECNQYPNRKFVYYSLANNTVLDREPDENTWDLLFTKYVDTAMVYVVTGVLTNDSIKVARVAKIDTTANNYGDYSLANQIGIIGYDWKTFNMNTMTYEIDDSLMYFVKDALGNIFKLHFLYFAGSSTGKAAIACNRLYTASVPAIDNQKTAFALSPNPAKDNVTLVYDLPSNYSNATISILDITGRKIESEVIGNSADLNTYNLSINHLTKGVYVVVMESNGLRMTQKLIVE